MSRNELHRDFSSETYNDLPSIEEANEWARADGQLDQFLREAAALFVRYQMQDRFGVALLHRHHLCGEDERMIQYYRDADGERMLMTMPVHGKANSGGESPHVWAVFDGMYYPLEFTTDGLARDLFLMDDVAPAFLTDFAALIKSSAVGHLFGLAIVRRTLSQGADDSKVLLEHSILDRRESKVYLRNRDDNTLTITTAWTFSSLNNDTTIVSETTCVSTQRCQCIVDDPGVPGYPPKHSHVPKPHHVQRPE